MGALELGDQGADGRLIQRTAIEPHLGDPAIEIACGIPAATECESDGAAGDVEELRALLPGNGGHAIDIDRHVAVRSHGVAGHFGAIPGRDDHVPLAIGDRTTRSIVGGVGVADPEAGLAGGGQRESPIVLHAGFVRVDQAGVVEPVRFGAGADGIDPDHHRDAEGRFTADRVRGRRKGQTSGPRKVDRGLAGGGRVVGQRGASNRAVPGCIAPGVGAALAWPACHRGAIGERGDEVLRNPFHFQRRGRRARPTVAGGRFDLPHVGPDAAITIIAGVRSAGDPDDIPAAVFEHVERSA